MQALVVVLVVFFIVLLLAGPIVLQQIRRVLREQKNYERGLKTILLWIQLPPPSEDIELGGRDSRDVINESISQAQTIYSIISSTIKPGFRNKIYGQRHFSFEIVGSKGLIHFYAAVPIALLDTVKQAIISAYPSTRLEEVSEQNIFSPVGKISGAIGGELSLKEEFGYPISTYQDLKRDPMQAILNSLSTLANEDGAGIQILIRPADPAWRKAVSALSSSKRKGSSEKGGRDLAFSGLSKLLGAESSSKSDDGGASKLNNVDQNLVESIDEKGRYPGFEVLIRVIASSNVNQRAQAIVSNVVSSFALFDAPGKNGFKYTPAKDMEKFVTSYIMRFFPPENNKNILNSVELATLFHFPEESSIPTSQLERQASKQVDGPRNIPEDGILLGYNVFRSVKKAIRLSQRDRRQHIYVVGQTGVGKSTFIENLAMQDMVAGNGFAFVDPHGDTAERLLALVPRERTEDLIYFCPSDRDYPMGLNFFEYDNPDQKDFLIQESIGMLYKLYDPQHQGIMGPRYEHLFRMAALTVMADPAGGTFIDIPKLFRDNQFVKQKLQYVKDQNVLEFWQKEVPQSQRSNEYGEVTSWFVSKFGAFLGNEMMRNIIGQTKSAFDLREVMDQGKILLVNLSKGKTGELNSKLLGMIFVMKFQAAAMSRANIPEEERKDFCLYVDEFQNFATDSFATIMSEARKYRLNLIVANQFTTQLEDEVRDAVFGNIGTTVAFRVGQNDVDILVKYFQPLFDGDDLLRIPNYNTVVRTLINGVPTQPFSMATLPAEGRPNIELVDALKQLSAAKYGRPRAQVETEIFERLATKEPPKPAYAAPPSGSSGYNPVAQNYPSASPKPAGNSSFLDDWLKKRQTSPSSVPASAVPTNYPPSFGSQSQAQPQQPSYPSSFGSQGQIQSQQRPLQSSVNPVQPTQFTAAPAPVSFEPTMTTPAPQPIPQEPPVPDNEFRIIRDKTPAPNSDSMFIDPSGNVGARSNSN
jgi:hypothetical protein